MSKNLADAMSKPVDAVVVLDALRYEEAAKSEFVRSATQVAHCVATSNWTLPSLVSILSGKESDEHGVRIRGVSDVAGLGKLRGKDGLSLLSQFPIWGSVTGLGWGGRMLFDNYARPVAISQMPMLKVALKRFPFRYERLPLELGRAALLRRLLSSVADADFVFVHLKGPHRPLCIGRTYSEEAQAYLAVASDLVRALPEDSRWVVLSDHGEDSGEVSRYGFRHGVLYSEKLLHVPFITNVPLKDADVLCSNASAYSVIAEGRLMPRDFVYSAHGANDTYATTTLVDGRLKIKVTYRGVADPVPLELTLDEASEAQDALKEVVGSLGRVLDLFPAGPLLDTSCECSLRSKRKRTVLALQQARVSAAEALASFHDEFSDSRLWGAKLR